LLDPHPFPTRRSSDLIAYPLAAEAKLKRVEKLMEEAEITVAVDSVAQADILAAFFKGKKPLNVWIKVNSGLNRIGVEPNEEVVRSEEHTSELQSRFDI